MRTLSPRLGQRREQAGAVGDLEAAAGHVDDRGRARTTNGTSTSRPSGVRIASRSWLAPWITSATSPTSAPSVVVTASPTSWWS